jgi:hypothetical protein
MMMTPFIESSQLETIYEAQHALSRMDDVFDALGSYIWTLQGNPVYRERMWKRFKQAVRLREEAQGHLSLVSTGLEDMERAAWRAERADRT